MTWPKYVLLAWLAVASLLVVGRIGKAQKPTTPAIAVYALLLNAGVAALVVIA